MNDTESINIPAFKRKRSIAAKARKTNRKSNAKKTRARKRIQKKEITEIPLIEEIQTVDLFEDQITRAKTGRKVREFKKVGICEGYFDKVEVAVIKLVNPLRTDDIILIAKQNGMFEQEVKSMQINGKDVSLARTGSDIGIKVNQKPQIGTAVYRLIS